MVDADRTQHSRRNVLKIGGSTLAGTVVTAGCLGTGSTGEQLTPTAGRGTVAMAPVGNVEFETPPETVVGEWGFVADVLTALGHGNTIAAMMDPSFWYTGFYEELDGVPARDPYSIPTIGTHDALKRETLYGLGADMLAIDPNKMINTYGLDRDDITELEENAAPFFGNHSRDDRGGGWPNYPSGESYQYYTIPGFVEKYGQVFDERDRAAALVEFYEETLDGILSDVPDEDPTVALLSAFANPENFGYWGVDRPVPNHDKPTYGRKQYRDIGVEDAFEGEYTGSSSESEALQIDSEALLEVDPDIIFFREAIRFVDVDESKLQYGNLYKQTRNILESDPVTQKITAVQEGNLYVGGTDNQGPIINLFQTEMLAKQLYPETFGTWPGVGEVPPDEELVDRDRLAEIVTGSV